MDVERWSSGEWEWADDPQLEDNTQVNGQQHASSSTDDHTGYELAALHLFSAINA